MSEQPKQGKTVLNAHIGKTNVIESNDIDKILYKTFETIGNVLSKHCGPFGRLAMLPDPKDPKAEPTFTKDGINIVKRMEFVSPMERYIKDTVAYIGARVEKSAGDGTTSSMILVTEALAVLREYLADPTTRTNYTRMSSEYRKFIELVTKKLDGPSINDIYKMDPDVIRNVAYHQAMTSSHGEEVLSNLIADMFGTFPYECWNYITFRKETVETLVNYSMEWDESDYTGKAQIFSNNSYNDKFRTSFELEDTELLIVPHEMIRESMDYITVKAELKKAVEEGRKLTVITANSVDPYVRMELEPILDEGKANPGHVSLFFIDAHTPTFNDLNALCALGGAHAHEAAMNYVRKKGCKVTLTASSFKVWGLVDRSKVVNNNHPDYDKPATPVGSLLQMLDMGLEQAQTNNTNNINHHAIEEYKRMYSNIRLIKRGQLVIGGAAYDNEANFDVVVDVLKATRATLRYGACLGGYNTLASVLDTIVKEDPDSVVSVIASSFLGGIKAVRRYTLTQAPEEYTVRISNSEEISFYKALAIACDNKGITVNDYIVKVIPLELAENEAFQKHMLGEGGYIFDVNTGDISVVSDVKEAGKAVIVQPKSVDLAMIKRFGEVAIKFLFTERIVVPGGVVVNE